MKNINSIENLEKRMCEDGWSIVCQSPYELEHKDGGTATGLGAELVRDSYIEIRHWLTVDLEGLDDIENDVDKLRFLNSLAESFGKEFVSQMEHLESVISDTLNKVSSEARDEMGYFSVQDVTQDINIR